MEKSHRMSLMAILAGDVGFGAAFDGTGRGQCGRALAAGLIVTGAQGKIAESMMCVRGRSASALHRRIQWPIARHPQADLPQALIGGQSFPSWRRVPLAD
ncbi:MAG: hypothetical protein HYR55_09415 [Acidobacteria bacterium]|nr:hypothetical protein [Acidobacteriota bacterium]MBI3657708.1 hypothetical protein [Acidobacteriota bacterium]